MIPVLVAYLRGLHDGWHQKRMLLLLYLANVISAYLVTLPISLILKNALHHTVAASQLMEAFDITLFHTIRNDFTAGINFGLFVITYAFMYSIMNTFFAGGILKIISDGDGFNISRFFSGCIVYFTRFIRIFIIFLFFIIAALFLTGSLAIIFISFSQNAPTEFWPVVLFILCVIFFITLLALINMLSDYTKIIAVVNDFYSMLDTTKNAILFVMMSLRKTTSLYGMYFITGLALFTIYWMIERFIPTSSLAGVLLFIIISQLYILSRIWIRLCFFSGQYIFFRCSAQGASRHG